MSDATSGHSPRRMPQVPEAEPERRKLHRLLDKVLDQADGEEAYNPDSESERIKRRRQRRPQNTIPDDHKSPPVQQKPPDIPHKPVVAQVTQRPDSSILRLHYNPYEAGDRVQRIAKEKLVELKPKELVNDEPTAQFSARSNPPLFFDESHLADRAFTATDAYAYPKRVPKTRIETDREAILRHEDGRVQRKKNQFINDPIHLEKFSTDRHGQHAPVRDAWMKSEINREPPKGNDYRDEFAAARKSVINTKNIISSIHDDLQHMGFPSSSSSQDYHA